METRLKGIEFKYNSVLSYFGKDIYITICSEFDDIYNNYERIVVNKARSHNKELLYECNDDLKIELAAKSIISWKGIKEDCTFNNAKKLCSINYEILDQVIYEKTKLKTEFQEQIEELRLFAENEFELSRTEGGATVRDHLAAIWRQTGVKPPELESAPFPEIFSQHWADFLELHSARTSNGFGANPITFVELDAWVRLTGNTLTSTDVKVIKMLDSVYLKFQAEQQASKAN